MLDGALPENLKCMLPEEGVLTDDQTQRLCWVIISLVEILVDLGCKVYFSDWISHMIDTGDAEEIAL